MTNFFFTELEEEEKTAIYYIKLYDTALNFNFRRLYDFESLENLEKHILRNTFLNMKTTTFDQTTNKTWCHFSFG